MAVCSVVSFHGSLIPFVLWFLWGCHEFGSMGPDNNDFLKTQSQDTADTSRALGGEDLNGVRDLGYILRLPIIY